MYAVLSFITPPVAPAIYVAMSIAKSGLWKTGLTAMRLAIVAYIAPFIFVYNPAILLKGETGDVILGVITSIIGISTLSFGLGGRAWGLGKLNRITSLLLVASGIGLFIPEWKTDLLALLGIAIVTFYHIWQAKKLHRNPVVP